MYSAHLIVVCFYFLVFVLMSESVQQPSLVAQVHQFRDKKARHMASGFDKARERRKESCCRKQDAKMRSVKSRATM